MSLVELLYRYGFSSINSNSSVFESVRSSSTISEIRSPNVPLIAEIFGVKTQNIDSVINLASIVNNIDHWEKG
jgi:hypothetical protein